MDRFERYGIYLTTWGRGSALASPVSPPDPAFADAALASGVGVYHHMRGVPLLSLERFDALVRTVESPRTGEIDVAAMARELQQAREAVEQARSMEKFALDVDREVRAILDAGPGETTPAAARRLVGLVPDVGPTERDERERDEAAKRLQRLILADGKTDTGGRWLYDAAADEIVRLRGVLDVFRSANEAASKRLAEYDEETQRLAATARHDREQGAAEMRGRAAGVLRARMTGSLLPEEYQNPRALLLDLENAIRALPIDGEAMARQGAAGERAAAALDGAGGISAEDAETLRGANFSQTRPGVWVSDHPGATLLRWLAVGIRAEKAPAVAHMGPPGKATGGEENATAGKGSVAEEPRGAQGALRCVRCSAPRGPAEKPHACTPVALPKPKRVEVGQRWLVDWRDLTGEVDEYAVEAVNSDTARLIGGSKGVSYRPTDEMLTSLRWTFLGPAATTQGPDGGPEKSEETDTVGLDGDAVEELFDAARGVRLAVPKGADARAVLATVAELLGLPASTEETAEKWGAAAQALVDRWTEEAAGLPEALDDERARLKAGKTSRYMLGFMSGALSRARGDIDDLCAALGLVGPVGGNSDEQADEAPVAAPDREALGRAVHEAAEASVRMVAGWEHLSTASREWRCAVGERLFAMGAQHGRGEAFRAGLEHGERVTNAAWKTATGFATPLEMVTRGAPSKAAGFYATGNAGREAARLAADVDREVFAPLRTHAPITPPAERYAAPEQAGGDVPAGDPIEALDAFAGWADSPRGQRYVGGPGHPSRTVARGAFLAGWRAVEIIVQKSAPPAMRIEQREDGEYLIGSTEELSACDEQMDPADDQTVCCHHVDGHHVAVSWREVDGGLLVLARWPIAPPKPAMVERGSVWRCVGVDGELEVDGASERGEGYVCLRRDGMRWCDVSARPADMLGLPQWTFVSGPRE